MSLTFSGCFSFLDLVWSGLVRSVVCCSWFWCCSIHSFGWLIDRGGQWIAWCDWPAPTNIRIFGCHLLHSFLVSSDRPLMIPQPNSANPPISRPHAVSCGVHRFPAIGPVSGLGRNGRGTSVSARGGGSGRLALLSGFFRCWSVACGARGVFLFSHLMNRQGSASHPPTQSRQPAHLFVGAAARPSVSWPG